MSSPIVTSVEHGSAQPRTVTFHVNERPVEVPAPNATGLQIKDAAIAAHLPVERDFVLSEERHGGDTKIVGNADVVTVNRHSRFLLVPPDDNS